MSPLTGFIFLILLITTSFSIYAYKKLQEPYENDFLSSTQKYSNIIKFLLKIEIINGRLAMIGFITFITNYCFFDILNLKII